MKNKLKYINENSVVMCKCGEVFNNKSTAIKHAKTHIKEIKQTRRNSDK